jgi:hypothetical protein
MALHILNICVDTPDVQSETVPEDLTINDMESIVEIVLEKGFKIDNAISEHDEPDENDAGNFEMIKDFKLYSSPVTTRFLSPVSIVPKASIPYNDFHYSSFINEISPPPPKA